MASDESPPVSPAARQSAHTRVHTVTAERSGDWWVLQAVDAPGAISQVASLDDADQIKEAIAFVTGEPVDTIEVVVHQLGD
jgi:hypothetical protein